MRQGLSENNPGCWIGCERGAPVSRPSRSAAFNPLSFCFCLGIFENKDLCLYGLYQVEQRPRIQQFSSEIKNNR
jgi:hypothetical protein